MDERVDFTKSFRRSVYLEKHVDTNTFLLSFYTLNLVSLKHRPLTTRHRAWKTQIFNGAEYTSCQRNPLKHQIT